MLDVDVIDIEISADILKELPSTYQKSVGFMAWDYARAIAIGGFSKVYTWLKYLVAMGDLYKLDYDDVVRIVFQRRGIKPRLASFATGVLTVTGTGTIAIGDLFETASGLQFQATEAKSIETSGTVIVECVTAGADGNVPASSISVIPVTIAGITAVTNESALTGGYDKESKESIIERYLEDIQQPITSNNKNHFRKLAKERTGVGDAKVKPLWNGDNTVKVVLIDLNNGIANQALVNDVQRYIDPFGYKVTNGTLTGYVQTYVAGNVPTGTTVYSDYDLQEELKIAEANEFSYDSNTKYGWGYGNGEADCGCYTTVISADAKNIDVVAQITLKDGAVLADVQTNIETEIKSYFKSTVFNDSYISYAKVGACILKADGVLDYNETSFKINNAKNNITLTDTNESVEIAVLNSLTITEG